MSISFNAPVRFSGLTQAQRNALTPLLNRIENRLEDPMQVSAAEETSNLTDEQKIRLDLMKKEWLPDNMSMAVHSRAVLTHQLLTETGYQLSPREESQFKQQLDRFQLEWLFNSYDNDVARGPSYRPNERLTPKGINDFIQFYLKHKNPTHHEVAQWLTKFEKAGSFTPSDETLSALKSHLETLDAKLDRNYANRVFSQYSSTQQMAEQIGKYLQVMEPAMSGEDRMAVVSQTARRYHSVQHAGKLADNQLFFIIKNQDNPLQPGTKETLLVGRPGALTEHPSTNGWNGGMERYREFGNYKFHHFGTFSGPSKASTMNDTPVSMEVDYQNMKPMEYDN